jgi:hypothetical protein
MMKIGIIIFMLFSLYACQSTPNEPEAIETPQVSEPKDSSPADKSSEDETLNELPSTESETPQDEEGDSENETENPVDSNTDEESEEVPNDPNAEEASPDDNSDIDNESSSSEEPMDEENESSAGDEEDENPIILSDLSRLDAVEMCQLKQTMFHDGDPPQSKGFPLGYNVVPPDGIIDIAILAVDFPDVPGDPTLIDRWVEEVYQLEAWSQFVAGDKMKYRVHFVPQWITTPRDAKWYGCEGCLRQIQGDYEEGVVFRLQDEMDAIDEVFTAADDYYDWSEMEFAHMIFPPQAEAAPHYVRLYSHGGDNSTPKAGNVFVPVFGGFMGWRAPEFTDYTVWDLALHEVLHEQGLMGHGPRNGGDYSVMQDQHGYTDMILSWEAFILGWWDENHLACISEEKLSEPFVFELDSLDENGITREGPKNLMIPMNDEEILVIEYRTDGPFSDLPEQRHGIMAYYINVNHPQFRCDGCDDLSQEEYDERNFWFYLTDSNRNQPCVEDEPHPVFGHKHNRYCNGPAYVHIPGTTLSFEDITITILDKNIVQVHKNVE